MIRSNKKNSIIFKLIIFWLPPAFCWLFFCCLIFSHFIQMKRNFKDSLNASAVSSHSLQLALASQQQQQPHQRPHYASIVNNVTSRSAHNTHFHNHINNHHNNNAILSAAPAATTTTTTSFVDNKYNQKPQMSANFALAGLGVNSVGVVFI